MEGVILDVISAYAPQDGCEMEENDNFWSELDDMAESLQGGKISDSFQLAKET